MNSTTKMHPEFEGLEAPEKWLDSREGPVRPTEATL